MDPMEFGDFQSCTDELRIPFFFNPVHLPYRGGRSFIVDRGYTGAIFPIWIFDVKGIPRWPTIGFRLSECRSRKGNNVKVGILSYALDIAETIIDRNDRKYT